MARHDDIDFVTFTGSTEVGKRVQKAAAERTLKGVLELGVKRPRIVFEDADLERAATFVLKAITQNGGQTCSAGSDLLVQRSICDSFVKTVTERFAQSPAGTSAMDMDCGRLINADRQTRVQGFIDQARASGIPVPAGGFDVAPTMFGPVLAVIPFDDEEDAITLANAPDSALLAGIWTRDGGRQVRVAKRMQCGQGYINCCGAGAGVELPFGGVKKSGHGRESGVLALEEFCNVKTVVQYHGK